MVQTFYVEPNREEIIVAGSFLTTLDIENAAKRNLLFCQALLPYKMVNLGISFSIMQNNKKKKNCKIKYMII